MCLGARDEIIGCCAIPFYLAIAPIVFAYRILQCIFYDIPVCIYRLTRVEEPKVEEPSPGVIQVQQEEPQPPFLRISIPVSEDPV
jgi:hypothetical protein